MRATAILLAAAAAVPAAAQDVGTPGLKRPEFTMQGAVNKPTRLPPDVAKLRVPVGYSVEIAASDLGNARIVAAAADGTLYVTRREQADVLMLKDADRDGRYETKRVVANRAGMHGIALDRATAYLITVKEVYSAPILADGALGPLTPLVDDLPDGGQHANRTIAVGPDGALYVSIGSTCNACTETDQRSATILRMGKDGKGRRIYASGLRNTIGFDWNPADGQLWGFDHGIDWLGDDAQPEELNAIAEGKRYGWPYIYADGRRNPQDTPPNGLTMEDWDRMSERMTLGYTAHAAPMQLAFARAAAFPADAQKDAFVTFRGSWNRSEPSGYEVARVRFGADGRPAAIEPFMTGFLTTGPGGEAAWTGRPNGLAFAPDGSMLVTDSENGVLYRVRYTGPDAARPMPAVARPMPPKPADVIAIERPETAATGRLTVSSSAFAANGAIPLANSNYGGKASPPLAWSGAPAGTRSYVVIADDPDASIKPVTHWVAWNIPAAVTALPQGLAGAPQLAEPARVRQGAATNGMTGWYGPNPPIGDKPHRYHLQVFALDTELATIPGSTRDDVLRDMAGHVLAKGELVGTYQQKAPPPKL